MSAMPAFDAPSANRQLLLARRPSGHPLSEHFELRTEARPAIGDGQVLVRNLYLSVDPVQRGWAASAALGEVMRGLAVGVVVESRNAAFAEGDLMFGIFGWQDYAIPGAESILTHVRAPRARASLYAGLLGMPGVTAHLALRLLAPLESGQRLLVSTAAGAVGSVVGQLAALAGVRAVGLTGDGGKVKKCLARFGYAACANYKTADVPAFLDDEAGEGFHTYFDNTGGWILDQAIRRMRRYGRVIQCGTAATPVWTPPPVGWRNEREILTRVLTWSGFYIFDHHTAFGEAVEHLTELHLQGLLNCDEDISAGFDKLPSALDELFSGANDGKKLVFIGKE